MPLERRHQLLALAREYGVPIFEDECYADLTWGGMDAPPALYSLDPSHVIHIGSFSKTLAPALRLGYVHRRLGVHEPDDRDQDRTATAAPARSNRWSSPNISRQHFQDHVDELSRTLKGKLDTMVEAVEREFGTAVEPWMPKGGIFLWMKLPDQVDVAKLVQPALECRHRLQPRARNGRSMATPTKSRLRLCFALTTKEEIREGVAAFARVCHEQTGIPEQSGNIRYAARALGRMSQRRRPVR